LRVAGLRIPTDARIWLAFFAMGFLNNLAPFTLFVWGQSQIASGLASILNATTPLFTIVVAHIWTHDERLNIGRSIGLLFGFAGVVVMIGPALLGEIGADVPAQLACLAAACSYAFAGVYGRRFRRLGVSPIATATGQVTASTVMLLPVVAIIDRPWTLAWPEMPVWTAVIGLAVLSTALAYILYFRILASAGASNLLLVTFLIPVSAILLGTTVLGEGLAPVHIGGMALIGLGLMAIDGRPITALIDSRRPVVKVSEPKGETDDSQNPIR
jgi:drug/metabolite transporter (DMT)-like permease